MPGSRQGASHAESASSAGRQARAPSACSSATAGAAVTSSQLGVVRETQSRKLCRKVPQPARLETALRFSIRLTNKTKGALADYDAHEKIYRAIRNGNADAASRACRELIAEALALVIKSARSR